MGGRLKDGAGEGGCGMSRRAQVAVDRVLHPLKRELGGNRWRLPLVEAKGRKGRGTQTQNSKKQRPCSSQTLDVFTKLVS